MVPTLEAGAHSKHIHIFVLYITSDTYPGHADILCLDNYLSMPPFKCVKLAWSLEFGIRFIPCKEGC